MITEPVAGERRAPVLDGRRRRTGRLVVVLLALVAVGLPSLVTMSPALRHCNTKVIGTPGDATAGGVWLEWSFKTLGGPPWSSRTPYTAAPEGEEFWQPHFMSALLVFAPMWAFAQVTSPVCAWNLSILLGFLLSGLAMFALARKLTRSPWVAAFAAFAFVFSPYRQYKATAHIAYVHAQLLVLLLLACVLLWERPTRLRAAFCGVVLAGLAYTDGYYILLGWVAYVVFHLAAAAHRGRDRQAPTRAWVVLRRAAVGAVVAVILMIPLLVTLLTDRAALTSTLSRSLLEVELFSARPGDLALPARSHPVFDDVFGAWQDARLGRANYSERTLYPGWTVLGLASVAVVIVLRKRRRARPPTARAPAESPTADTARGAVSLGLVVAGFGVVALVALLFMSPPVAHFGPLAVPMPSKFVFRLVTFWRVYARFFILFHAALVVLAAVGLAELLRARRPAWRPVVAGGLGLLLAFEFLTFPPQVAWGYDLAPSAYRWLARRADVDLVAEYPLYPDGGDPNHVYLTYQPVHGKRLLNARLGPSPQDALRRPLYALGDPQTIPVLRRLGVDLVLVHPSLPNGPKVGGPPAGLEPVASFSYDADFRTRPDRERLRRYAYLAPFFDVDVYRIGPGPAADLVVAMSRGFWAPEAEGWRAYQWMRTDAELVVRRLAGGAARATVAFEAGSAFGRPRELTVEQGGQVLWRGSIQRATRVAFEARVGVPIRMHVTPGATAVRQVDPTSLDERVIAARVSNLAVEPVG